MRLCAVGGYGGLVERKTVEAGALWMRCGGGKDPARENARCQELLLTLVCAARALHNQKMMATQGVVIVIELHQRRIDYVLIDWALGILFTSNPQQGQQIFSEKRRLMIQCSRHRQARQHARVAPRGPCEHLRGRLQHKRRRVR